MVQRDAESNDGDDATTDIVEAVAGAGPSTRDCPVCMEPAEWVGVGPCGHREVCVTCAARMRFVELNMRCCICRAFCPTVVITKQQQQQQEEGAGSFPKPPLAAGGGANRAGTPLLDHTGMAAYFDDQGQYERARRMCRLEASGARSTNSPSPNTHGKGPNAHGQAFAVAKPSRQKTYWQRDLCPKKPLRQNKFYDDGEERPSTALVEPTGMFAVSHGTWLTAKTACLPRQTSTRDPLGRAARRRPGS
ncbi:hypothetical protein HU200_042156 [Digitaria exilis]|uniref:RING-type domain-containing protein n=1 Tax=Digitaria exilis TaxID=1010633 RepID=A0A835EIL8_9POAL|nr:hypothetical protein HU200_042156 [Digitaria exilis]